jgi:hypothetical protein
MIRSWILFSVAVLALGSLNVAPAKAVHIMKTATRGGLRVELHVMPAEPFYTAAELRAKPGREGMLVLGGAKPLQPDAEPRPNCHLVVHVFDARSGKPVCDARVRMKYRRLDDRGRTVGSARDLPVVVMQVAGKSAETTHYGNNVVLPDGRYVVTVTANGRKVNFDIVVSPDAGRAR